MPKSILFVAGEISGDHHGAPLISALKEQKSDLLCWGLGGDEMEQAGLELMHHVRDLSVTGFVEVLKHLSFFKKVMSDVENACRERKPDAAVLIDYPGFNIRLGKTLKDLAVPVYYYISPQVWAWKKGRVKVMREFIRHMFVIFPFEADFYRHHDIPASFVGHPLVEKPLPPFPSPAFFQTHDLDTDKELIALLPGSRVNEVNRHIGPLVDTVKILSKKYSDLQFGLAGLSSIPPELYEPLTKMENVRLVMDQARDLLAHSKMAIVASGTATLETAFLGIPMVVIYKISWISYFIGRLLVDIEHLAMPNLILAERAVPELIQHQMKGNTIAREVQRYLDDPSYLQGVKLKLQNLRNLLGEPGCADHIAKHIIQELDI